MRGRYRVATAAVALLALTASACGGGGKARTKVTPAPPRPTPTPVALTPQLAADRFRSWTVNDDVARAAGDERLALSWVVDGQYALTAAEFRKAAHDGDPVPRFSFGRPTFYVPRFQDVRTYPQWFVASVPRTEQGKPKSTRTALMAFILRSPGDQWKLSVETDLAPKAEPPKVVVDAQGYATALETGDTSVLIRPRDLPGIQATIAAEGPSSVASNVMASGPVTTGMNADIRAARKKARKHGLAFSSVVVATPYPIFALRAEHGSALVLYSLFRSNSLSVKAKDRHRRKPPIPPETAHLLDGTVPGYEIDYTETLQLAASDPAKPKSGMNSPKADVIGYFGTISKASAPLPKPS
ncbi:hypothetical protein [Actinomadura logoneensis]|uniref:hypothetical protein n=1 Tax=Actinomadura logoneensis TaxID=2293572 RepID=UPI0011C13EE0|nr:hypothetical protein [Actinomadura logoneensis]